MIPPRAGLDPGPLSFRCALGWERSRVKPGTGSVLAAGTDLRLHAMPEAGEVVS